MIHLGTPVQLLDAVGAQVETGVVVGRCRMEPALYDIRVDGPGTDSLRINVPADRVVARQNIKLAEIPNDRS
jgi:hypothetical protein